MTTQKLFCLVAAVMLAVPVTTTAQDIETEIKAINQALAADGLMIGSVEWITSAGSGEVGRTIYFENRGNKQLNHHFAPYHPYRGGYSDITYRVDMTEGATASGLTADETHDAIIQAMSTWNGVNCSAIPLTNLPELPMDLGYVQYLLGFGGFPDWFADLTHGGWLPPAFFDAIADGGGGFILGVTFTFTWTGTDFDNNGLPDVAFREIYYNDDFNWTIDDNASVIDVESIALHEAGHGLSQAHFGTAFRSKNGKLHFAPRAVMNASYSGIQRKIRKTDNAGHCSIWDLWPDY